MSDATSQVDTSAAAQTSASQATSTQASSSGQQAAAQAAAFNGSTTIKSLDDLKKQAPKVYNSMMQGIAMTICNEMKEHQDQLKELMRQGRENS